MTSMPNKHGTNTNLLRMLTIDKIPTYLGWTFTGIIPGTFKRNRKEVMHLNFPILAPLPSDGIKQKPLEGGSAKGPFIYFIHDDRNFVFYIGKSKEAQVLKRWIRPGNGGPASHYWTHSTKQGGCVFNIANGLATGLGPFHLRFTPLSLLIERFTLELGIDPLVGENESLDRAERALIRALNPAWNCL